MLKIEQIDFNTIVKLYYQYSEANGFIPKQPSESISYSGRKYYYLHNINGLLAKYEMKKRGFV